MDKLEKMLLIRIAVGFLGVVLLGCLIGASIHPIDMAAYDPPETSEAAVLIPET